MQYIMQFAEYVCASTVVQSCHLNPCIVWKHRDAALLGEWTLAPEMKPLTYQHFARFRVKHTSKIMLHARFHN